MQRLSVALAVVVCTLAFERSSWAQSCTGCGAAACCVDPGTSECVSDPSLRCATNVAYLCGTFTDSCGNTINCGTCTSRDPGTTCFSQNICCSSGQVVVSVPDGDTCCSPTTCSAAGAQCGTVPDGCDGTLNCGGCPSGETCTSNKCVCTPTNSCSAAGAQCGTVPDGCGNTLSCGSCQNGQNCTSNKCVAAPPVPATPAMGLGGLACLLTLTGWGLLRRQVRS